MTLAERIGARIHREGPISFADYQAAALYDEADGFFASGSGAGRAGRDFITSPEVGTLFGALVARHLDATWRRLGEPDPFVVVEVGAGRGRLAADVLRAAPACALALRYVLVERAAHLRGEQRALLTLEPPDEALGAFAHASGPDEDMEAVPGLGPIVTSLEDVPAIHVDGVVLANELLDDLPVHLVERGPAGWAEVRVGIDEGALDEVLIPAPPSLSAEADEVAAGVEVPTGARLPVPIATRAWLERVAALLRDGEVVLVDYADEIQGLLERGPNGPNGWLRTYRAHGRGSPPLDAPGSQDITTDVPLEYLRSMARRSGFIVADETDQREWLHRLGIDELVADGTRTWEERAHVGDLAAIAGRSRATEAAALTDPNGLGAHRVVTLQGGAASGATGNG